VLTDSDRAAGKWQTHLVAAIGLPQVDVSRVQRWCEMRVPAQARDEIRVECQVGPRQLTIVERRPPWRGNPGAEWTSSPVARLLYTKTNKTWALHWCDSHGRFHRYDRLQPSPHVADLLAEINADPTNIFWG
jgi:Protein of unknown function (DUF3024)